MLSATHVACALARKSLCLAGLPDEPDMRLFCPRYGIAVTDCAAVSPRLCLCALWERCSCPGRSTPSRTAALPRSYAVVELQLSATMSSLLSRPDRLVHGVGANLALHAFVLRQQHIIAESSRQGGTEVYPPRRPHPKTKAAALALFPDMRTEGSWIRVLAGGGFAACVFFVFWVYSWLLCPGVQGVCPTS